MSLFSRPKHFEDLPDMRVGRAAITISSYFSQKTFIELFGEQSFAENWTVSDALGVWYALGYFCYLTCVSVSGEFEPHLLTPLLDSGYDQLLYQWKMPDSVSSRFKVFVKANIREITRSFDNAKDPTRLNYFFVQFSDRIMGGSATFANTSLPESLLKGDQLFCTNPILATSLSRLFIEAVNEGEKRLRTKR